MTTLTDLQNRASKLSKTRDALSAMFAGLNEALTHVKNEHMRSIRMCSRQVVAQHKELADLIRANPALFTRPRTFVFDGLKFGLQKQPGKLSWEDDDKVCAGLRRLVAAGEIGEAELALLITVRERPDARGLEKLDGRLLKKLGITVGSDTDEPLIKSVDGDIEKAVNAVIKEATADANAEVAA